jgi:hypothetical protein
MPKYPGRIISATPPTVNTSTASGIWTLEEALQYKQAGTWPVQIIPDPNFNQTVLLLHGDGTNGAQNNTFLDSSTNNFTITKNGNTTQGTFSPFSLSDGYWSNFFDSTNDRLTIADNAVLRPGTGNFTIEAWVYRAAAGAAHTIFAKGASTPTGFAFGITSSNTLRFTDTSSNIDSTGTVAANTWVHVAVVREGTGANQLKLYINGVQDGQGTVSTNFNQTEEARIGENRGATDDFNGYISNFRYVVGSAIYTAGFTPSTSPLTTTSQGAVSSEVELLTCQSNRFVDNSTNAFAITRNGDVRVTPFSPFAPTAEYDPAVNGGSGYFDGTGDYLTVARNSSFFPVANEDFTFEAWVYLTAAPGATGATIITAGEYGALSDFFFFIDSSRQLTFYFSTGALTCANTGTLVPINAWTHVAVSRSGTSSNNLKVFVNGVGQNFTANNTTVGTGNYNLTIGADQNGDESNLTGYISNLRIVKGTAQYTSNFTPPTSPVTAITNTSLLLNFTNAGIIDNTGKNVLETVGNAQIDTTTKKFGTGSLEFDGTGDWLLLAHNPDQFFGTGPFTIEFWVYLATGDIGSARGLVAKGTSTTGWLVSFDSSQKVVFTYTTSTITSSGAITTNAWNYIAVVREGTGSNQTKIYIGGTNDGTGTVSTDFNQTSVMYVGANRTGGDPMKGFIDDLRVTKGVARYTANFTPPNSAFQDL